MTSSRVVMHAIVTLRSTTGVIISRIALSMARGTILPHNKNKMLRNEQRHHAN